jgi:hypothetical protein
MGAAKMIRVLEISLFCSKNHEHEWFTPTYSANAPALIFSKTSFDCTPFK